LSAKIGRFFDGRVQVVDVRLMVLAMVDLHRRRVDVRLESVESVRQLRKSKSHSNSFF